jgi:Fe-S-cluster containining protein
MFKANRGLLQRKLHIVKEIYAQVGSSLEAMVIPLAVDGNCPFLNKSFKCAIYSVRPEVCRMFGDEKEDKRLACPYIDSEGKIRETPLEPQKVSLSPTDVLKK